MTYLYLKKNTFSQEAFKPLMTNVPRLSGTL